MAHDNDPVTRTNNFDKAKHSTRGGAVETDQSFTLRKHDGMNSVSLEETNVRMDGKKMAFVSQSNVLVGEQGDITISTNNSVRKRQEIVQVHDTNLSNTIKKTMAEVLKGSLTEKERELIDSARDMLVDFSKDGKLSRAESMQVEQAFEKAYDAGLQDPNRNGGAKKGGGHSR